MTEHYRTTKIRKPYRPPRHFPELARWESTSPSPRPRRPQPTACDPAVSITADSQRHIINSSRATPPSGWRWPADHGAARPAHDRPARRSHATGQPLSEQRSPAPCTLQVISSQSTARVSQPEFNRYRAEAPSPAPNFSTYKKRNIYSTSDNVSEMFS